MLLVARIALLGHTVGSRAALPTNTTNALINVLDGVWGACLFLTVLVWYAGDKFDALARGGGCCFESVFGDVTKSFCIRRIDDVRFKFSYRPNDPSGWRPGWPFSRSVTD